MGYHLFSRRKNSGISKAYNVAADYALKSQKNWIILLDQDTEFSENTLEEYLKAIKKHPSIFMFAPILKVANGTITSPYKYTLIGRKNAKVIKPGIESLYKTSPINSGLCINTDAYFKAGGYNEEVKLDGADFQFIERFRKVYKNYVVLHVNGLQHLSNFETDINKLTIRYKIFLKDISAAEKQRAIDYPLSFVTVLYRTLRLTFQTKKTIFISIFFRYYIFNNQ